MLSMPLRAKYPKIYSELAKKLDQAGLHAFEVKADILLDQDSSEKISIKFGDGYTRESLFHLEQEKTGKYLDVFLNETIEKCQNQAVEDYYTFMDIRPVKVK